MENQMGPTWGKRDSGIQILNCRDVESHEVGNRRPSRGVGAAQGA